jgi:hypothetical protein
MRLIDWNRAIQQFNDTLRGGGYQCVCRRFGKLHIIDPYDNYDVAFSPKKQKKARMNEVLWWDVCAKSRAEDDAIWCTAAYWDKPTQQVIFLYYDQNRSGAQVGRVKIDALGELSQSNVDQAAHEMAIYVHRRASVRSVKLALAA